MVKKKFFDWRLWFHYFLLECVLLGLFWFVGMGAFWFSNPFRIVYLFFVLFFGDLLVRWLLKVFFGWSG